jgi:hypothetical protein
MIRDRLKEIPVGREQIEQVTALGGLVVDRARSWAKTAGAWGWAAGQQRLGWIIEHERALPIGKLAEKIKQAQQLDRAEVTRLVREELPTRVRSTVVSAWEQARGRFAR